VATYASSQSLKLRVEGLSRIENFLDGSLEEIIDSYGTNEFRHSNIEKGKLFRECLNLDLSSETENLLSERCKLGFHRDRRSTVEYGLDLVFGWMSEDLVLRALRTNGIDVVLSGEDKFREFLTTSEIGTTPDFLIKFKGQQRQMEIVFSWNGYWKRTNSWDIRDSKFRHLTLKGQEALCLGIELPDITGFIMDMKEAKDDFNERSNAAWGNKKVYTLIGINARLKDLREVLRELDSVN